MPATWVLFLCISQGVKLLRCYGTVLLGKCLSVDKNELLFSQTPIKFSCSATYLPRGHEKIVNV
jgi:hypothetical protein